VTPPTAERIREEIIPVLSAALRDEDRGVRDSAAIALGRSGDGRDVGALIKALKDADRKVMGAAILGLGLISDPAADQALIRLLADVSADARDRGLAALALGLSGGEEANKPLFDDLGTWKNASIEMTRMLGAALWTGADRPDVRNDRAGTCAGLIRKALAGEASSDRAVLSLGIAALSKTRDAASADYVVGLLRDPRSDIRAGAAIACGRIIRPQNERGVKTLIEALKAEGDFLPRRFMLIALGRIGGAEAVAQLRKELESRDSEHRAFTILALGVARATDVAPVLRREVSQAGDQRLKGACALSLGIMKDPEAFKVIVEVVKGRASDELLWYCMDFFAMQRNPEAIPVIRQILSASRGLGVRETGSFALGAIGALEAQPILVGLAAEGPPASRSGAVLGIGRLGDHRGVEALVKLARKSEPNVVRAAAIEAIGRLAQRKSGSPLTRIAIDHYYASRNEPIEEVCARVGGIGKLTENGGGGKGQKSPR
jgi:HEAT repeat protein